jgi:hypothetical protein
MKKAEVFKISAVSVKSRMWWKNIKVRPQPPGDSFDE